MTVAQTLLVAVACAGGAALQATAGFGFALLAAPALVRVLGPVDAIGVIGVLSVLVNALTLRGRTGRIQGTVLTPELLGLAGPAAVGLLAGALLLGVVPDAAIQAALAVAVVVALVLRQGRPVAGAPRQAWRVLTGFAAGVMTTTIGVNGPPLVLWLRARQATPDELRCTLAVAFLVAGGATLAVLAALGKLHPDVLTLCACAAGVGAGHAVGSRRAAGMAVQRHERLVTGALVLSAVAAALSAIA